MKKAEAILAANHAVEGYNTISGFSLLTGAYSSNIGLLLRGAQAVGGAAHARRSTPTASSPRSTGRSRKQIPEGVVVAFGPPAIPGLGTGAGFTMQLQDRVGRSPEFLAEQAQRFMQAAQPAAGDWPHLHALSRDGAADLRRHRPFEGAEGRRAAAGRQHDARRAPRQRVRQRLQPVRARVQGVRPGRTGVPARSEAVRSVLRARDRADRWCRSTRS